MHQVRVWDLPTRVFHGLLVLMFAGLLASGEWGGDAMAWHFRLGYGVLVLLLFRLLWGIVGGRWSRFAFIVKGPAAVVRYIRGEVSVAPVLGHNPLGGYSVLAFLTLLFAQVVSGLFSDDEIATAGPFARLGNAQWVSWASEYHTAIGKVLLIGLVGLHLLALVFHWWRGQRALVPAMWHGLKDSTINVESVRDDALSRVGALLCLSLCVAAVAGLLNWVG